MFSIVSINRLGQHSISWLNRMVQDNHFSVLDLVLTMDIQVICKVFMGNHKSLDAQASHTDIHHRHMGRLHLTDHLRLTDHLHRMDHLHHMDVHHRMEVTNQAVMTTTMNTDMNITAMVTMVTIKVQDTPMDMIMVIIQGIIMDMVETTVKAKVRTTEMVVHNQIVHHHCLQEPR